MNLAWATPNELPVPLPVPVRLDGEVQRIEMPEGRATLAGRGIDEIQVDPFMRILRKLPTVPTCEEREAEQKAKEAA